MSCSRPMSYKPQMCGWLSAEIALASRLKRARNCGIVRQLRRENLEGYGAVQARVAGSIHLAHAAGAEQRDYLVRAELRAGGQPHGCIYEPGV